VLIFHRPVNAPPGYIKSRKFDGLLIGVKNFKEDPVL
jgi:hypothetical protein